MNDRNARFARRRDLRDLRTPPYGLFLGYHGLPARPLISDLAGHALVVAPTRAGKGVGLLMQNALSWPSSMIVLDPKGEFRQKTLHWRAQYQRCFTWGPTTFSTRWNPLVEIAAAGTGRDPMEEAMRLARAFASSATASRTGGTGDSFWNTEATSFLAHAFLWAAIVPEKPATLAHVYDLLCRPADLNRLHRALEQSPHATLANWARAHRSQADTVGSSILATARSYLRSFASGPVRDATAAAELTYAELLAPATTLYLHASATDFTTHGQLLIAFLEGFISRALSHTAALAEPLLLLLDEFSLLPALPSLRTLLTLSAGYHLRLLIVLQSVSQVSPEIRDIVLGNSYDQVFFAARDLATTEHLSKRLGTVYRKAVSRSHGRSGGSRSESERRDDLLATHQIRGMSKSLLFHGNAPPARITLRPYYKDKRFTERLGEVLPPTPTPFAATALDTLLPDEPADRPESLDGSTGEDSADAFDALDELLDEPAEPGELLDDDTELDEPANPDGEQACGGEQLHAASALEATRPRCAARVCTPSKAPGIRGSSVRSSTTVRSARPRPGHGALLSAQLGYRASNHRRPAGGVSAAQPRGLVGPFMAPMHAPRGVAHRASDPERSRDLPPGDPVDSTNDMYSHA